MSLLMKYILALLVLVSHISWAENRSYYTLAITLTPAFCADARKAHKLECKTPQPLLIHGLWPESTKGRSPEYCQGNDWKLSDSQQTQLSRIMPDKRHQQYEWNKHGKCSGLSAGEYTDLLLTSYKQLKWPDALQPRGRDITIDTQTLLAQIQKLNPSLPNKGIVLRCERNQRPAILEEIRVCLSSDGKMSECFNNFRPNCPSAVKILSP